MINCRSLLTCAAVGSPEDQAGKWLTRHKSAQVNCTSIHSSLWAPGSMRMMPCSLHAGHHSSWHRREDLHAISNVRYDLRWRSLLKLLKFLHFVFCFLFLHWKSFLHCAGYVPFGTPIVSPIWKSYILIMRFIELNLAVQRSIYMLVFGDRWNETLDLFCPKNKLLFPGLI